MNKYSLNTILSRPSFVWTKFLLALCILFTTACKKEESDVGIDIVPEEDLIGLYTTDTMTLVTYTVIEDSLRTDESPTVVMGHCEDQRFGTSNCGVYSQFSIPNNLNNIDFLGACISGGAVLDSCVLMLAYKFDYYGDTSVAQTFSVYQMTDMIYKDLNYYSNQDRNYYPSAIGSLTFLPQPRTKVNAEGALQAAHLRIPIDMAFANQLFAQSAGPNLSSNQSWLEYLNGLYITPTGGGESLLYFNMQDTLTGLRFYYHTSCNDTTDFTFVANASTAYYNRYTHDYSGLNVDPELNLQLQDTSYPSPVCFVQSNAGLKTKIKFPYLKTWYDNLGYPAAINKAELVIFGIDDPVDASNFPLNTRMFLTSIDSVNREHLIIDMFESNDYYGGSLNTTTNVYKINIARHLQGILSGEREDNGLYLKEIFGTENGRRSTIGSSYPAADPAKRMYLRLVYTRIN